MHTEVHVHGTVMLRSGATQGELEQAIGPWLDYVDIDSLAEARSAHQDEPGIVYDRRRRVLEICWTGWVGRKFQQALESAFHALCAFAEEAAGVEVTYYQEDGRDERGMVFVGPTAESIEATKRRYVIEDISALLLRHFSEAEISEIFSLVNQLFERRWAEKGISREAVFEGRASRAPGKRHLL